MSYQIEELKQMPISRLRSLDIRELEDEMLVQRILDEKMQNESYPDSNRAVLKSSETDNMTPEKEAALQARLDGELQETPEVLEPESELESEIIDLVPEPEVILVKAPFCQFCDSKGVRHKKECTRLLDNK